ncbi:hypothetical protein N7U66_13265 [Lacinutrix neustonica]|uniref:Lipoprotein n=1 Tax=Lacinutrix neustonica TaxID=2980107 RepID=A0A9E8MVM4_9FLAO|nr:hypothetical protein [Lacinutrix neustonica]WAC01125.1 hypothetical protein N7U66_13265 [Lacinutrix neustonica]
MKFIYLSLLILTCSCVTQKTDRDSNEDYQVLNAYLEKNKDSIIFNTNTLVLDYRKPESFFQSYLYFSKKFKTKKKFFSEKEIEELKTKYPNWQVEKWNVKLITKKNLILTDSIKKEKLYLNDIDYEIVYYYHNKKHNIYMVSKPFYDRKNKKAFLIVEKDKIMKENVKLRHNGKELLLIKLKKTKGKWRFYGGSPIY